MYIFSKYQIAVGSMEIETKYFVDALHLFHETQWLYNTPVTELLSGGLLNALPTNWLNDLQLLTNQELNNFVAKKVTKPEWSETLKCFVEQCKNIDRLPVIDTLAPIELPHNFKIGLSCKKQHEIVNFAHLIHTQCSSRGIKVVVDLGAGLGYVCQLLYYLYGYQVLGLERNQANVNSARVRQRKLYSTSLEHVKYDCCDLTCDSAETIEGILQTEFGGSTDVCLIGLHACGDLSIYASRIFNDFRAAKILIMISCCYHKLAVARTEKSNGSNEKQYFRNFPLSRSLRDAIDISGFDIGRFLRQPFLRLACQEPADRWCDMTAETHFEHSFHVLARAVLQLYVTQNALSLKKCVKKATRKSQCLNFQTYVKDVLLRYTLEPKNGKMIEQGEKSISEIHEKNMTELWQEYCTKRQITEIYCGLHLMLQAPAESLVLYDRLCWMQEQGLDVLIIPVTNKRLSPRSHAIVSRKYNKY